ncbi:uncharacterized protein LOC144521541 [Sander vitreus]
MGSKMIVLVLLVIPLSIFQKLSSVLNLPGHVLLLDHAFYKTKGRAGKTGVCKKSVLDESVEKSREIAIRVLMVYLREKEEDLFKEQLDGGDIVNEVMKIVKSRVATMSDPTSARIFIEGTEVLQDLDVPRACVLLMWLIYGLNLSYPK